MFLRYLTRSLSFTRTSKHHAQKKDHSQGQQDGQPQQPQWEQERDGGGERAKIRRGSRRQGLEKLPGELSLEPPSTPKPPPLPLPPEALSGPERGVEHSQATHNAPLSLAEDRALACTRTGTGTTTSANHPPTGLHLPTTAHHSPPPRREAAFAKSATSSASAAAVTAIDPVENKYYIHSHNHQTESTATISCAHASPEPPVHPESTAPAIINTPTQQPVSILDPADHNPVSNFPIHPLHLQTLSPNPDHHPISSTAPQLQPKLLHLHPSSSSPLLRNEPKIVMQRKVWVKRPGASATRVEVNEDDLVDNVRDVILHKYANSLGRHIDSPDITLKIASREQGNKNVASERTLGPDESIGRTLDTYYPGGQTIDEALLIEVTQKRTPKPSPRPGNHHAPYYISEDYRPGDGARDYFPPMPLHSPHVAHVPHPAGPNGSLPVHSMSILTTGQVPALPSPGGHSQRRHVRPKYGRQHTSSPTIIHSSQSAGMDVKSQINGVSSTAPPLPTPPPTAAEKAAIPPPNRTTSPHSNKTRRKKQLQTGREINGDPQLPSKPASAALLNGRVPPINVLLVEDNPINLKLLEQFMKRLKVRWKSAVNGKEAVNMWREGGFHLVLMDIQLPVMNGLEATKEIRRLESVNGIGLSVFGETMTGKQHKTNTQVAPADTLEERELFKSPVIIVALTASSLQSDRHEALAVGCNDFLTKPVNFGWMERKVTEWGCMQALIDFNGWRKWKEIAEKKESDDPVKRKQAEKEEKEKARAALKAMFTRPPPTTRREDASGEPTNGANSSAPSPRESNTSRRHKGSRSQSSGIGSTLGTTVEVDEKEG